jgi:TRAP-type C4-dicarboxylate transport system permease large subunit
VICLARGRLAPRDLLEVLLETVKVTSFLFMIIVGASILTCIFGSLRLPSLLVEGVKAAQLSPWLVMAAIWLIYIALGMFVDSISIMVMTLPVLFPLIATLGFDPGWFGVVLVILLEIGLITPPVGMNLFVLRGISGDVPMKEIAYGTFPIFVVMLVGLLLPSLVPALATWLLARMR